MRKSMGAALLLGITLRLAAMAGALDTAITFLRDVSADGRLLTVSLGIELGNQSGKEDEDTTITTDVNEPVYIASPVIRRQEPIIIEEVPAPEFSTEILPTTISGGMVISNATGFSPDIPALLSEPLDLSLPAEGPQILIIHTHGSEAYAPDGIDQYVQSDSSRTQDTQYNVIRVGEELAVELEKFGLNVIHDREIYDYPSYTGSYSRSLDAVESYLELYPDIAIVIDLHRDALGSGDVIYKTVANVQGESSSQLMLLVGTGENGLYHPYWQENLKLALRLQSATDKRYPTLARPVALKQERYNQHVTTGSLILEVGSNGNTLREALCAVRLFANAIGDTLKDLVDK